MKSKIWIDLLKLIVIFGGIWAAFVYIPWFPDEADFDFPLDKEEELGDMILEDMLENDPEFRRVESERIDSAIWVISRRLIDSLGLTDYDYNIVVVRNQEVNAFALPGGNIVVLSGLIEFSESPSELAAVLAHEMGHVEERHVVQRLVKELGLQLIFGVLSGGDAIVLSEITRTLTSTFFNREQEAEADEFALDLLHKCRINPRALGTLFRRMESEYGSFEEFELLMSHPAINSRIKASFEYELGDEFESRPFALDWKAVQSEVNAPETPEEDF